MKTICLVIQLIFIHYIVFAAEPTAFPHLTNPEKIFVDADHIYITEFPTVYIHSRKDFKLIKRFGRSGEGPQEFKQQIHLTVQPKELVIQSSGRASVFSRQGEFIREFKSPYAFRVAKGLGKNLVLAKAIKDNQSKGFFLTVSICKRNFDPVKEIYRVPHFFKDGVPVDIVLIARGNLGRRMSPLFYPYKENVFIEGEHGLSGNIYIYDKDGNKTGVITHKYPKMALTQTHRKEIKEFFTLIRSAVYRILNQRKMLAYPGHFPAIRIFHVADDNVYVVPYPKVEGKSQLFVFNFRGNLIKKALVALQEQSIFEFSPYTIGKGRIYQLVENSDSGDWELFIKNIPQ